MNFKSTWHKSSALLVQSVPGSHDGVGSPGQDKHHHVDDGHLEGLHEALLAQLVGPVLIRVERLVRQKIGCTSGVYFDRK